MEKVSYNLLVADDEYWIREKIRKMIDWEKYSIVFMKPAENGEEVLERIPKEKPDILITDINMPFVNGVDLVKAVRNNYPEIIVFVLSGYDDFQYVRETLMAGAINYLLKPVSKIDMIRAVSDALEMIGKREQDKEQILKTSSMIQDRELSMLVQKEHTSFAPASLLGNEQDMAGCSVMLIKLHEFQRYVRDFHYDMNLLSYHIKNRIKKITGAEGMVIFNHIFRSNEFIIATKWSASEQKRVSLQILDSFAQDGKSPVTIAVSEHAYTLESIYSAYIQSVSVLMTRPFNRESVSVFYEQKKKSIRGKMESHISPENERQMRILLKSGNIKALKELILEGIGLSHCVEQEWSYLEVRQSVKRICNLLLDHILQMGQPEQVQELESLVEMADKAVEQLDNKTLCEIQMEIVDSIAAERRSEMGGSTKDIINTAAKYIDANYFEELTLMSLSEKYNVESSYFSRMFKQETGKNLMLYITEKRIEKAKEYMEHNSINLTEIAFMTGYDDYTYFSRVFKKMTGKSPREYRSERI